MGCMNNKQGVIETPQILTGKQAKDETLPKNQNENQDTIVTQNVGKSPKILVLFYTTYGHAYNLAKGIAEGVQSVPNIKVDIKRVPETLTDDVLKKLGAFDAKSQWANVPIAQPEELADYDGIIFGSPSIFGLMAAQMKTFIDQLGGLWMQNKLVGKIAGVFTSSSTQHGGNETALVTSMVPLMHLGFVISGLPYSFDGQKGDEELKGGSPYGASTIAGATGARKISKVELEGAKFQGKHIAQLALCMAK